MRSYLASSDEPAHGLGPNGRGWALSLTAAHLLLQQVDPLHLGCSIVRVGVKINCAAIAEDESERVVHRAQLLVRIALCVRRIEVFHGRDEREINLDM